MLKTIFFALVIACLAPTAIKAQTKPEGTRPQSAEKILAGAEEYLRQGETCFNAGDYECARREFDRAIDYFLELGLDLRSDEQLHKGWRAIIEKINRYQLDALSETRAGWKTQEFNGRPVEEQTEIARGHGRDDPCRQHDLPAAERNCACRYVCSTTSARSPTNSAQATKAYA